MSCGGVAQWSEQRAHNLLVAGSSPAAPTINPLHETFILCMEVDVKGFFILRIYSPVFILSKFLYRLHYTIKRRLLKAFFKPCYPTSTVVLLFTSSLVFHSEREFVAWIFLD